MFANNPSAAPSQRTLVRAFVCRRNWRLQRTTVFPSQSYSLRPVVWYSHACYVSDQRLWVGKIGENVAFVWKVALLMFWIGICRGAESSIYAYTESDGAVFLSNVPTDKRYTVFVKDSSDLPQKTRVAAGPTKLGGAKDRSNFSGVIDRVANLYGLESALLHAVISVESNYDPAARSSKGASGLMQLMPGTAKRYGVADAFNPEQNIEGGARYLRDLSGMFDGDLSLVLAAYNAGEGAVMRNQNRIPPFRETLDYVPKVLARYRKNQGM